MTNHDSVPAAAAPSTLTDRLYDLTGGRRSHMPKPPTIRLNGKSRSFELDSFDEDTNGYVTRDVPGETLSGTILLPRNMLKWKYEEDKTVPRLWSDEFDSTKSSVFTIWKKQAKETKLPLWSGTYDEAKQEFSTVERGTGKERTPWDFFVVLYVVLDDGTPEGKIVRLPLRGDSRSEWFDWNQAFHKGNRLHLAERHVRFAKSPLKTTPSGIEYVSMTFADIGPSPFGEAVVGMIESLKEYFAVTGTGGAARLTTVAEKAGSLSGAVSTKPMPSLPMSLPSPSAPIATTTWLARVASLKNDAECDEMIKKILGDTAETSHSQQAKIATIEGRREAIHAVTPKAGEVRIGDIPF